MCRPKFKPASLFAESFRAIAQRNRPNLESCGIEMWFKPLPSPPCEPHRRPLKLLKTGFVAKVVRQNYQTAMLNGFRFVSECRSRVKARENAVEDK